MASSRPDHFDKLLRAEHPESPLVEDHAAGDMICPRCGLVVGDRIIDVTSEWRTFSNNDGSNKSDPSRVGASEDPLLGGSDLTTFIALPDRSSAKTGSYKNRPIISSAKRVLLTAFRSVDEMADRAHLSRVVSDRAKLYYKQAQDSGRVKFNQQDAIAAACLFIACRQEGLGRTFKEICAISNTSAKVMGRYYYKIKPLLGIRVQQSSMTDFIPRFCAQLDLPIQAQTAVAHVARTAVEASAFSRRSPLSVVAAAIYLVCQASDAKKTSQEVGEVAGVADVTIRQVYKVMLARAEHLFPASFVFKTPIHQLPPK